jgi:hypothetical protein
VSEVSPPSEEPLVPDRLVLRAEYDALREDLRYTGARIDAARSFGVAAVGAVLTLAIQQQLAVIALAAMAITYCFTLIDLVNAHRYGRFAQRAKRVELALDAYEEYERRPSDRRKRDLLADLLLQLGKRPYQAELNEPGRRELAFVHPRPVFKFLYPLLLVGSAALAVVIEARSGSAEELWAVTVAALALLVLFIPRFLDPTWPPIAWWLGRGRGRARRIAWWAIPVAALALIALGLSWVLPALHGVPDQGAGSVAIGLAPRVRAVRADLRLAPDCSDARGTLTVSWHGHADRLTLNLPANLTSAAGGAHSVSLHPEGDSVTVPLQVHPGEEVTGRCTLALPSLVGSGQAEAGLTRLRLPARFGGFGLEGLGAATTAQVGPCTAAAAGRPASTCSGLVHLVQSGSSDERLRHLALGAVALLAAALLLCGLALAYKLKPVSRSTPPDRSGGPVRGSS